MTLAESERGLDFAGKSHHEFVAAEWPDDLHGNRHAVWRKSTRQRDRRLAAQVERIRVWGPSDPWQWRLGIAARRHLSAGVKGHDRHGGHEEKIDGLEELECGAHKRAAIADRLEEARKRIGPRQRAESDQARVHDVGVSGKQLLVAETSRRHPERLEYFARQWCLDGHVGIARRHRGGNFRARSGDHGLHRTLGANPEWRRHQADLEPAGAQAIPTLAIANSG